MRRERERGEFTIERKKKGQKVYVAIYSELLTL